MRQRRYSVISLLLLSSIRCSSGIGEQPSEVTGDDPMSPAALQTSVGPVTTIVVISPCPPSSATGDSAQEVNVPTPGDSASQGANPAPAPGPQGTGPDASNASPGPNAPAPEGTGPDQTGPDQTGPEPPAPDQPSPDQNAPTPDPTSGAEMDAGANVGMDAGATLPSTPATDPFAVESKCSSGQTYIGEEGSTMRPGEACINCHESRGEGPRLTIAGTVYPTGHEPNDCRGANRDTGVSIVITDADGNEYTLEPNQSGNFTSNQAIATPYTARLVTADGERKMFTPQTIGDCNSCHTQDGMSGAPGRIVLP